MYRDIFVNVITLQITLRTLCVMADSTVSTAVLIRREWGGVPRVLVECIACYISYRPESKKVLEMAFVYSQTRQVLKKNTFFVACRISAQVTDIGTFWIPSFNLPSIRGSLLYSLSFSTVTFEKRVEPEMVEGKTRMPNLFIFTVYFVCEPLLYPAEKESVWVLPLFEQMFKKIWCPSVYHKSVRLCGLG